MFIEVIAVYLEFTGEYINTFCVENSDSFEVVSNDTCWYMYCLNLGWVCDVWG